MVDDIYQVAWAPTLFLGQLELEVWRVEKNYFRQGSPLFLGLDGPPPHPPLSEGLDLPLFTIVRYYSYISWG